VSKGTPTKITVALLTLALVAYFVLLGGRAIALIRSGGLAGVALGIGVLLLPIIGVVLVVWELRFGWQTERLARRLAEDGQLPEVADLPVRPSGRVERDAADAHFETVKARVEAAPEDWRGWFALAHAYDLAGDRKRARSAMRHAIELEGGTSPD
jgi:cytochrome c-type biogenesis protein CcmH/NrfG